MKTKKYITITALSGTILSSVFFENLYSQNPDPTAPNGNSTYETAVGIRGGGTSGLTVKQFTSSNMALEGILGIWPFSISATGLIEFYAQAQQVPGLNWYYGFGGHAAFETGRIYYASEVDGRNRYFYREGDLGLGIDGILGIEYKIIPIPFALSLDIKPFLEVNTEGRAFMALDPGLGVKFTF